MKISENFEIFSDLDFYRGHLGIFILAFREFEIMEFFDLDIFTSRTDDFLNLGIWKTRFLRVLLPILIKITQIGIFRDFFPLIFSIFLRWIGYPNKKANHLYY